MRTIDADALYKKLKDIRENEVFIHGRSNNKDCCTLSTALFEIDCAPTIELASQWVPVSERLPEEDKDVLVTVYFAGLTQKHKTGWNDHIKPSIYVDIASYYGGDWVSASDEYKVTRRRHRVIAWMPLPEPYRAERRTDETD